MDREDWGNNKDYARRVTEALFARRDVWLEEQLAGEEEPTVESLRSYLLPPLYVNAPFKRYPVVLSLAEARDKVRYIHDGSQIHLRFDPAAKMGELYHDARVQIRVYVGESPVLYGSDLRAFRGPRYEKGYLPIVRSEYEHDGVTYSAEALVFGENGAGDEAAGWFSAEWKWDPAADRGRLTLEVESKEPLTWADGGLRSDDGSFLAYVEQGAGAPAAPEERTGVSYAGDVRPVYRFTFAGPVGGCVRLVIGLAGAEAPVPHREAKGRVEAEWEAILGQVPGISTPDTCVNEAYKALIIGSLMIAEGDRLTYSHGNAYQRQYMREIGWASLALTKFGLEERGGRYLAYLIRNFRTKSNMELSGAGYRLQAAAEHAILTRNPEYIRSLWPTLTHWAEELMRARRSTPYGILPRERYAGDLGFNLIYNLRTNVSAWRGLRDFGLLCEKLGETEWAERCAREVASIRRHLDAILERTSVPTPDGLFVPTDHLQPQEPFERLTGSRLGSYYNIDMASILETGYFTPLDGRLRGIVDFLQRRGGYLMGLLRSYNNERGRWGGDGWNDLYAWGYNLALLWLEQVDHYVVSFFARLGLSLARGTYVGAEVLTLEPLETDGLRMGQPPNTAYNGIVLHSLRHMFVHEESSDYGLFPDTLKLCWATPRRWLAQGGFRAEQLPTPFGVVSLAVTRRGDEVEADLFVPEDPALERLFLRLRLPKGEAWGAVTVNGAPWSRFDAKGEWIALSDLAGRIRVRVAVSRES